MNYEELFYKELSSATQPPADSYDNICKKISRKTLVRRSSIATLAVLFLVVGIVQFERTERVSRVTIEPEVASELQIIQEYLNGSDVTDDNSYAYINYESDEQ